MKKLAFAAMLLPTVASAHQETVPHLHPHGFELAIAALFAVVAVAGLIAWQRFRR